MGLPVGDGLFELKINSEAAEAFIMEPWSARLSELLTNQHLTLAVAESCTGGLLGGGITAIAGSSLYFRGGVIAYHNDVKRDILGVPSEILGHFGAVSAPVAEAMAAGAAKLFGCDCAMSITGIAGPGGGTAEKPVGLVFVGAFCRGEAQSRRFVFAGDRDAVRRQSVAAAVGLLIEALGG
jgi:PncC family amidohydrolase